MEEVILELLLYLICRIPARLGRYKKNKIKNVCYFHKPGLVVNKDGTLFRLLILFSLRFKVQIFTFFIFL